MRALLLAFLLVAGCRQQDHSGDLPASPCRQTHFEGSAFTVCDPGKGEIRLFAASRKEPPRRSFDEVGKSIGANRIAFAMNAGMFGEDGRPIGLAVVDGQQLHALNRRDGGGNFHLRPNGVFMVLADGSAVVLTSDEYARRAPKPRLATQSGPMLVIDGKIHPAFDPDGSSRLPRNGVGVTSDGQPLFVISDDSVSFGKFARFFRDRLHTPNALYFDGAVSSLWDPAVGRQDAHTDLGPIIVALKPAVKPAASAPGREGRARP